MAAPYKQRFLLNFLKHNSYFRPSLLKTSGYRLINTSMYIHKRSSSSEDGSTSLSEYSSAFDPGPVFFREDVQQLLRRITGLNIDKVFKFRATKKHTEPSYELLTQSELQKKEEETREKAHRLLQMPPYLKVNSDPQDIISDDSDIAGHATHNIVFTDITYGIPHKERSIVVREPGGLLRSANYEERNRIQQVYFPREGKAIHLPTMFEEENLERMLSEHKYEYILDRACLQFEPDEPQYVQITHRTYEHVNSASRYEDLRSTRHFGPMSFYLAHYQKIEGLIVDMIRNNLITDAADLVDLYHIIYTDAASLAHIKAGDDPIHRIQAYLEHSSKHPGAVELALQTYKDSLKHPQSQTL